MKMKSTILLLSLLGSGCLAILNAQTQADSPEAMQQRVAAKVQRVYEGARKLAESGRDPSVIGQMMREKVKPLLDTGNIAEADQELDRVLTQLQQEGNTKAPPANAAAAAHQRVAAKIEHVVQIMQEWAESGRDPSEIGRAMEENVKPLLESGKFVEAEPALDRVLEQLGVAGKSTAPPDNAAGNVPEEMRNKLSHNLGSYFLLFREKVLQELRVTTEQKEKLDQHLRELLPEASQVLEKSKAEREKYNQKTHAEMAAVLKDILNEGQRTRLHQLELQKDGLFGPAWNMQELQVTDEQRQQFIAPTQDAQTKTMALMEAIRKGANPDDIRPKALQLRLGLEVKLEALLTDAQKEKWKEMLGKPVDLSVLFDGVPSR